MVPIDHSRLHARDFKGVPEDYIAIDKFLDQSKFQFTDWRHRMFLHNPLGISLVEQVFGDTIKNSDGIDVPTREIARRHIIQDCGGRVPTSKEWVEALQMDRPPVWVNCPQKHEIKWLKENYYDIGKD